MLQRLRDALRRAFGTPPPPPQVDAAVQAAAARCYREAFPERMRPPVSFQIAAETEDFFVVGVSNLDPGCIDFIRVAKEGHVATRVEDDQRRYRPLGLK